MQGVGDSQIRMSDQQRAAYGGMQGCVQPDSKPELSRSKPDITATTFMQMVSCIRCGAEGVWRAAWARSAAKPCAR